MLVSAECCILRANTPLLHETVSVDCSFGRKKITKHTAKPVCGRNASGGEGSEKERESGYACTCERSNRGRKGQRAGDGFLGGNRSCSRHAQLGLPAVSVAGKARRVDGALAWKWHGCASLTSVSVADVTNVITRSFGIVLGEKNQRNRCGPVPFTRDCWVTPGIQ